MDKNIVEEYKEPTELKIIRVKLESKEESLATSAISDLVKIIKLGDHQLSDSFQKWRRTK